MINCKYEKSLDSYLQECNEQKEGIGCPSELRVEESREEREDVIFGCAEGPDQAGNDKAKGGAGDKPKNKNRLIIKPVDVTTDRTVIYQLSMNVKNFI